jgi:hypothetical protein
MPCTVRLFAWNLHTTLMSGISRLWFALKAWKHESKCRRTVA